MGLSSFPAEVHLNERIFRRISYALVGLMMVCAAHTLSVLVGHIFINWPVAWLPAMMGFIAFERLFTYPRTRGLLLFSTEWLKGVFTEWIALALILRLVVGVWHGLPAFSEQLFTLARSFTEFFLLPEFIFVLVIAFITWMLTGAFASLLDEMGLDRALIALDVPTLDSGVPHPRARLSALVVSLGSALVIFTALVRVNLRDMFLAGAQPVFLDLSALSGGGGSTLLYFLFGLALLSQGHFITLHTQWSLARVRIAPGVARGWITYSVIFFALVLAIVSVLPTRYSLGMFTALGALLDLVVRLAGFLVQLLIILVVLIINLPAMLFGRQPQQQTQPGLPPEIPAFDPGQLAPLETGGLPWLEALRALVSWVVLLAVVGVALVSFVRQHHSLWQALAQFPAGRWVMRLWRWLRGASKSFGDGLTRAVSAGLERWRARRAAVSALPGGMSLRRLDARQRIRFFYLALVRRGSERGLARGPAQTPLEYAATLERALPESDSDIATLTDEFIKARYSRQPVLEEEASLVRRLWNRIRNALRRA